MSPITGYVSGSLGLTLPGNYIGPGDLFSSWSFWAGMRAFNQATIGQRFINLRRDSDNATADFATVAGGKPDVASILNFRGGANLFVTALYDQTLQGFDFFQSTNSQQPGVTVDASLTNSPFVLNYVASRLTFMQTTKALTVPQPFTISAFLNKTNTGVNQNWSQSSGADVVCLVSLTNNTVEIDTSLALTATVLGGWRAINVRANGSSSNLSVDGVANAGNIGTLSPSNETWLFGINTTHTFNSNIVELGFNAGGLTDTQLATLALNQRSFWGP